MGPSFCVAAGVSNVAGAGRRFPLTAVQMQTLTARMGEDMRWRGFALKTPQAYRGAVRGLATHFHRSPDTLDALTGAALRAFFLDLVTRRQVSRSTRIV